MFRSITKFISREIVGLHRAAYLLGFFTFLSQILGLFRDRLLAGTFGAGSTLDIYYAAFKIPDLLLVLGASLVSISLLVPLLSDHLVSGYEKGKRLIDEVFTAFSAFIILAAAILFIFVPEITSILFPGISGAEESEALIKLTRILLLSPVILGISNIFASIVQVHHRFFVYALAPILYNIGIIIGILFLYPSFGIQGLGYGVVIGAVLHAGIQLPAVHRAGFSPRIVSAVNWERIKKLVFISLPRAFTMSITQLLLVVLLGLASLIGSGAITIFNFSYNIQSVPLGIVGVSYSLAAFPLLSSMYSKGQFEDFTKRIIEVAQYILLLALPFAALFIVLRVPIVSVLFRIGEFGVDSTILTSASLAIFAVSIPAQSLQLLLIRAYYAAGKTMKPLITAIIGGAVAISSAFILSHLFVTNSFVNAVFVSAFSVDSPVLVLPTAYTIGMIVTTALLLIWFVRDFKMYADFAALEKSFVETVLASVVVGVVALWIFNQLGGVFEVRAYRTLIYGIVAGSGGILSGVFFLQMLGSTTIKDISHEIKKRKSSHFVKT